MSRETTGLVMSTLLRHLLAIIFLPFTMALLVPVWIARRCTSSSARASGWPPRLATSGSLVALVPVSDRHLGVATSYGGRAVASDQEI